MIKNAVAGVVIKQKGKYLLVQENRPKKERIHGSWNLPAGRVDAGDTIELTAVKEAKEESGFDVEIKRKLGVFQNTVTGVTKHVFEAEIIGGELKCPEDEILDAKWFTFEEIKKMKNNLRSLWVFGAISIVEGS